MSNNVHRPENGPADNTPPKSFKDDTKDIVFGDFDHSHIPFEKEEWPVVIIGSSMVGMMTGLLLGYHGIRSISFDRHPPSSTHPRAAGLNYRSSEILRQLGLEELARAESAQEFDIDAGMLVVEKLVGGKTLAHLQENDPKEVQDVTPCSWLWITQAMFEPLLRANAANFGCTQVYGKLVVHYEEHDDGVVVVTQDVKSSKIQKYKAQYLVACDGHRSSTRKKEGIVFSGVGVLRNSLSIRITGDLRPYLGSRAIYGVVYVDNEKVNGGFRLENQGRAGIVLLARAGEQVDFPEGTVTMDEARRYVFELSGLPSDAQVDVQSCSYWTTTSYVADRLQSHQGRVLIAGDAAHTMPPTGGLGGNTGIGDAHNLAWKLAYVIRGHASPSLIDSYTIERQPVDAFVVDQATRRFYNRVDRVQPPIPEESNLTVEVGNRYSRGAIIPSLEKKSIDPFENPLIPSGVAGSRFPHVFLQRGDERVSTLDLVKRNLVLISVDNGSSWLEAAKAVKSIPIDTYILNESSEPLQDRQGLVRLRCQLRKGEVLLIRPDGFIAWRGGSGSGDQVEELRVVLRMLLGR